MSLRPCFRLAASALTVVLVVVAGGAGYSAPVSSSGTYVVRAGDSLWRVAQTDGVTVDQLALANDLSPNGLLLIGTRLSIPTAAAGAVSAASVPGATSGASGTAAVSSAGAPGGNFCGAFTPQASPAGQLPALLAASPDRLALRPLLASWAQYYGVSPALVEAVAWEESGWQQGVISPAQAIGVGQLLPSTAAFVGTQLLGRNLDVNATSDNIQMTAAFLAYLSRIENGDLCRTLAAYYEGPLNLSMYGVFAVTEAYVAGVEALLPRFG